MLFSFAVFVSMFTGDCYLPVTHISSAQLWPFIDQSTLVVDNTGGLTTEGGFGGVTTGGVVGVVGALFPYDLYAVTKELNSKANK